MPTKGGKSDVTRIPRESGSGQRPWPPTQLTRKAGLFNRDAKTIARELASEKVSPKGRSSGMRMLTFYVNRAGKNLPARRLKVLQDAKELLHERIIAAKNQGAEKKTSSRKAAA
jgi:hypothetical protein